MRGARVGTPKSLQADSSLPRGRTYLRRSILTTGSGLVSNPRSKLIPLPERARAQETPNLQSLLQEITPKARGEFRSTVLLRPVKRPPLRTRVPEGPGLMHGAAMIQPTIRKAVMQEIEAVLEREVEKV